MTFMGAYSGPGSVLTVLLALANFTFTSHKVNATFSCSLEERKPWPGRL